jgi:hypothetical protein
VYSITCRIIGFVVQIKKNVTEFAHVNSCSVATNPFGGCRRVSSHKAKKAVNKRHRPTELTVIYVTAGEWGVPTRQPCGLMPIRQNRSRKVEIPNVTVHKHSSAPVSAGNTFQDLPRLRETADNTERYI